MVIYTAELQADYYNVARKKKISLQRGNYLVIVKNEGISIHSEKDNFESLYMTNPFLYFDYDIPNSRARKKEINNWKAFTNQIYEKRQNSLQNNNPISIERYVNKNKTKKMKITIFDIFSEIKIPFQEVCNKEKVIQYLENSTDTLKDYIRKSCSLPPQDIFTKKHFLHYYEIIAEDLRIDKEHKIDFILRSKEGNIAFIELQTSNITFEHIKQLEKYRHIVNNNTALKQALVSKIPEKAQKIFEIRSGIRERVRINHPHILPTLPECSLMDCVDIKCCLISSNIPEFIKTYINKEIKNKNNITYLEVGADWFDKSTSAISCK